MRRGTWVLAGLAAMLAAGAGVVAVGTPGQDGLRATAAAVLGTSPASYQTLTPDRDYTADLYVVEHAGGPAGDHHLGVDALLECMAADSLAFYRSAQQRPGSGPQGIVGPRDVVLIKVNSQWPERGGTNTDVLRGLIARILEHPDGFTGEIVVAENTQAMGTLDWAEANAEDHNQSALDVVNDFAARGYPVSAFLWDTIRSTSVSEYSSGDLRDGYVVGPWISQTQIRVSYPKFRTAHGRYLSLKQGIWDPGSSSYSDSLFTFLNVPVLKCHGAVYGVTGALKHHVGTMTTVLSTNTHNAVRFGGLGSFLADVRMPDLNILDAIYILAIPSGGPWCTYEEANRVDRLLAARDPVALDMWATKNILVPTILANGYTSYPMQDPDNPSSIFRTYLDRATSVLLAAGITVTNDLTHVVAHTCDGSAVTSVPRGPGEAASGRAAARPTTYPNPTRGSCAIRFDLTASGDVTVTVFGARGELVRTIRASLAAGPAREITWDGRDDAGRAAPSGTYFYRVTGAGVAASGKLALVR